MKVLRAETLGFCFGVEDAIEQACSTMARGKQVYSLGPLVHNKQVIGKLSEQGLKTVESMDDVEGGTVLIRAHGVDPVIMAAARRRGEDVVDATCVLVRRAQDAVKRLHDDGFSVVVIGDADHPEVKGIVGYAPEVVVIGDHEGLDRLPRNGRLGVVAQTTLSREHFAAMVGQIVSHPFREIRVINTLCVEVTRRQEAAIALCGKVEVMFVLGGLHSANTRELARVCREQGVKTYHLESWASFRPEFVRGCNCAGVTAGASTPRSIIDQFVDELETFAPDR